MSHGWIVRALVAATACPAVLASQGAAGAALTVSAPAPVVQPLPWPVPGPVQAPPAGVGSSTTTAWDVAPRAGIGPRLAGRTTVRVPLRASWGVTSSRRLVLGDGSMTCRTVALVRRPKRPATAASILCVGPDGSPGLSYRLTVRITQVRGAVVPLTVRFPQPVFSSIAALTRLAPAPKVPGTLTTVAGVTFLVPTGWQRHDYSIATQLTGPGKYCDVFVYHPVVPDMSGPDVARSLQTQVYEVTSALFSPTAVRGEYGNADIYHRRQTGQNGFGFPWVGLQLNANGTDIAAYLVLYGSNFAVPVVQVGAGCGHGAVASPQTFGIFTTMSVAGSKPTLTAYNDKKDGNDVVGEWSSSSTTVSALYLYAANRHYIFAFSTGGAVVIGGSLYSTYLNWAGDGNWAVVGPVLATFPINRLHAPKSSLISIFNETQGTKKSQVICQLSSSGGLAEGCHLRDK